MSVPNAYEAEDQVTPVSMHPLTLPDLSMILDRPTGMAGHLLFLFNLARETKARHIVEIGMCGADSSLPFLLALRETQGELTSIDIECMTGAEKKIQESGERNRWRFIQADSGVAVNEVRNSSPIDILLINGSQSYNQCRRDYFIYAPMVRAGGYILFYGSSAIKGVIDFTNELGARGLGGVNLTYCNGLYLFQKQCDVIW